MYNFSYHYYKGYYENFPYWDKLNISNDDKLSKIILNFFEKKNKTASFYSIKIGLRGTKRMAKIEREDAKRLLKIVVSNSDQQVNA